MTVPSRDQVLNHYTDALVKNQGEQREGSVYSFAYFLGKRAEQYSRNYKHQSLNMPFLAHPRLSYNCFSYVSVRIPQPQQIGPICRDLDSSDPEHRLSRPGLANKVLLSVHSATWPRGL